MACDVKAVTINRGPRKTAILQYDVNTMSDAILGIVVVDNSNAGYRVLC